MTNNSRNSNCEFKLKNDAHFIIGAVDGADLERDTGIMAANETLR